MVYSKDSEEEIFNKIFNNYFIKTNSDADVCYTEDIKNIYNLYVDKKNIGINSFIAFLVKNGCVKLKGGVWNRLLIKTDVIETIEKTDNKKELLKQVRHKINELKMLESKLLFEIMEIKSETNKCFDNNISLDLSKKNIYTISHNEPELVYKIVCIDSKVHSFSELFINLIELNCSRCTNLPSDIDLSLYKNLQYLNISNSSIDTLYPMKNLIHLICNNTDISALPYMENIETLDISNTHIERLDENMVNINELYCSNTLLTSIPNTLINLEILKCDNLYIDTLSHNFINLSELSICNTNIIEVPKTYTKLKVLLCHNTNMRNLPIELASLEYLDIHNVPRYDDDITWELINEAIDHIPETFKNLKTLIYNDSKLDKKNN